MILYEAGLSVTRARHACMTLLKQHHAEKHVYASLDKIRTLRRRWQQGLRFLFQEVLSQPSSPPVSVSSSMNTTPTSTTQFHIAVNSLHGRRGEYFSGTRSQVFRQVILYLMTGTSGNISTKNYSEDYQIRELSSFSWALLLEGTKELWTNLGTKSSSPATPLQEASETARRRSPDQDSSVE